VLKKKIWANFQRNKELFTKKIVKKLLKIWSWDPESGIRDPGSGKNLFRIPDPGVKKAPDPGSGSATLVYRIGLSTNFQLRKQQGIKKSRMSTYLQSAMEHYRVSTSSIKYQATLLKKYVSVAIRTVTVLFYTCLNMLLFLTRLKDRKIFFNPVLWIRIRIDLAVLDPDPH
jgi:hypothetical protein